MAFVDEYWSKGSIIDQSKCVQKISVPPVEEVTIDVPVETDFHNNDSDDENADTSSSSSSDTPAPECKTELGVPTWAPKQPADGCFFERTFELSSGVDFVVEFDSTFDEDGNRNRTGREFYRLWSEVFDEKVIEMQDARLVGGWRLLPDGTWKAVKDFDELRR
jgi:hypothetical protein